MPDLRRETAAYRYMAMPRGGRPDMRALLMLAYVVLGAWLIVTSTEPMTLTLVGLIAGAEPTDLLFETVARAAAALSIIALALLGALIAAEPPPLRVGPALITGTALPAGIGAMALVMASAWAGSVAIGQPSPGVGDIGRYALGTILVLLGVVAEELLFRGLLQPVLARTWGPAAGVLLSSLAFVVIHMIGGWTHPVSLLNILLAGIWFGLLSLRTGWLLAPILAHFGYNWAEEMIFGASPNPGIGTFGSILDVDLVGPAIWGGSLEGLNASLAVSVVLVALIVPLALGVRRQASSGGKAPAHI